MDGHAFLFDVVNAGKAVDGKEKELVEGMRYSISLMLS